MAPRIELLLADVDGTLVTHDKLLTERARAAVKQLRVAGIRFALTSGRPPRGMQMLFAPLAIDTPVAGYNGGMIVTKDLEPLQTKVLDDDIARAAFDLLQDQKLDVWVYVGNDWYITDNAAPHVAREAKTVQYEAKVVKSLVDQLHDVVKIVGVSDDHNLVKTVEEKAQAAFGDRATVARSQPYYLDITHTDANKGAVVAYLAQTLGIAPACIATIGDQPNDVLMFKRSGLSVAMGNASAEVKARASETTDDSEHEGFAHAVERLLADHGDADAQ